jgi:hypothetical protein
VKTSSHKEGQQDKYRMPFLASLRHCEKSAGADDVAILQVDATDNPEFVSLQ